MELDSEVGREAVRDHLRQGSLGEGRRDALMRRIQGSIAQGRAERYADELEAADRAAGAEPPRWWTRRAAVVAAIASVVLVGVAFGLRWFGPGEGAETTGASAAYAVRSEADGGVSDQPARASVAVARDPGTREPTDPTGAPPPEHAASALDRAPSVAADAGTDATAETTERSETPRRREAKKRSGSRSGAVERSEKRAGDTRGDAAVKTTTSSAARDLSAELALLRAARSAAARGDTEEGLDALRAHARRFPRGQLRQDREALRVELLCRVDPVQGRKARTRFMAGFPRSTHAARIEATPCGDD